ncbi:MAG: hypothetical protein ACRYFV_10475 [Janthinobacterium lividum]
MEKTTGRHVPLPRAWQHRAGTALPQAHRAPIVGFLGGRALLGAHD